MLMRDDLQKVPNRGAPKNRNKQKKILYKKKIGNGIIFVVCMGGLEREYIHMSWMLHIDDKNIPS